MDIRIMPVSASVSKKTFHFNFPARTSRGAMKEKISWFLKVWDESKPDQFGLGECGPLPGLSVDDKPELETILETVVAKLKEQKKLPADLNTIHDFIDRHLEILHGYPSVIFAVETALLDFAHGGIRKLFDNSFRQGNPIPINGLVWMGGLDYMLQEVEIKIRDGFHCLKLKIGGLDFEKECDILQYIRRKYFREKITIRLDANGSFKEEDAPYKLKELARFDVHSIEQPIRPKSEFLPELCNISPIPIALDEELIGLHDAGRMAFLKKINPRFLVLKPTLHGGAWSCREWIREAAAMDIGWWLTSALESNIGLNAIAQLAGEYQLQTPQGLGTGSLYDDNFAAPLRVEKGQLLYDQHQNWEIPEII